MAATAAWASGTGALCLPVHHARGFAERPSLAAPFVVPRAFFQRRNIHGGFQVRGQLSETRKRVVNGSLQQKAGVQKKRTVSGSAVKSKSGAGAPVQLPRGYGGGPYFTVGEMFCLWLFILGGIGAAYVKVRISGF